MAIALQAGAFLNQANANKMNAKLIKNGFDSRVLILKDSRDRTWYLVRSGSYTNRDGAQKACLSLKQNLGIKPLIRPVGTW
ncbi:MAG: SPOR domain-containing protein [Desulfobacula sp.]|nr:SPOR domain-containing protein [Desulfobacula sp.]